MTSRGYIRRPLRDSLGRFEGWYDSKGDGLYVARWRMEAFVMASEQQQTDAIGLGAYWRKDVALLQELVDVDV